MIRLHRLLGAGAPLSVALALAAAAPPGRARDAGDVMAVKVLPTAGRAELVVDVRGTVSVADFVLNGPPRLVLDISPARLAAPIRAYDGVRRGGIRNVRYGQFQPTVVRVVIDLDSLLDYEVQQDSTGIRVALALGTGFEAWPRGARATSGVLVPPPAEPPAPAPSTVAPPPAREARTAARQQPQQPAAQFPPISVRFDRTSMEDVIGFFSAYSGYSIILGMEIERTVTAEILNQPWDVAFYAILASQGLAATQLPGGIIRVDSREALVAQDSTEGTTTRRIRIKYARAASLQPSVANVLSARGRAVADTTTNSIIISEVQSRMAAVDSFVQTLDVRIPQVAIQARIIFVERTDIEDLGLRYDLGTSTQFYNALIQRVDPGGEPIEGNPVVNLGGNAVAAIANASNVLANGNPALELVYSTVIGNFALSTFLEALQQVSLADVEAAPQATVVDNRQAELVVGERTPIRIVDVAAAAAPGATAARAAVSFQETGIKLRVTPHVVLETREILMEIEAERSSVAASAISEVGAIFNLQRGTTQLLVRDGETAVIGGLTVTEVTVSKSGIPFLVDLPVVGRLFGFRSSREQRRDLLILVTPHIVDDPVAGGTNP